MKFQLITAATALLVVSVAAMPAPYTDHHGLEIDTDEWVDDGSIEALEARSLQPGADDRVNDDTLESLGSRTASVNKAADNFNFTSDFDFALDRLLTEIDEIPEEVLEKGDEALHKWLVEHGHRESNEKLKRDTDVTPLDTEGTEGDIESLSIIERDELAARASIWKVTKCIAAIVQLLGTTAIPAAKLLRIKKYIKALGGTKKAVKLLLGATTRAEKLRVGGQALVALAAELLGISTVKTHCF